MALCAPAPLGIGDEREEEEGERRVERRADAHDHQEEEERLAEVGAHVGGAKGVVGVRGQEVDDGAEEDRLVDRAKVEAERPLHVVRAERVGARGALAAEGGLLVKGPP